MSMNHIRPWRNIERRKSRQIHVGNVPVGADAPLAVQPMTNTDTSDVAATVAQVQAAAEAGADIVRVSTPDAASTKALREIVRETTVPIVADIHFHYKRAIEAAEAGAACLRINPGNIGDEQRVKDVIQAAKDHGCAIRIGVNAGSLEKHLLEQYAEPSPDAMVASGLEHIRILEDNDFHEYKISVKASDVFMTAAAYQQLAEVTDAPIHLGVTEAGGFVSGTIKSAIGLGQLLWMGIGDTLRVSLSADPVEEVKVGFEILKSLGVPQETRTFEVWNKLDLLPDDRADAMRERAARDENVLAISAITGEGLDALQTAVAEALQGALRTAELSLTFAEGRKRAWLFAQDVVMSETQTEDGFDLTVRWSADVEAAYQRL